MKITKKQINEKIITKRKGWCNWHHYFSNEIGSFESCLDDFIFLANDRDNFKDIVVYGTTKKEFIDFIYDILK